MIFSRRIRDYNVEAYYESKRPPCKVVSGAFVEKEDYRWKVGAKVNLFILKFMNRIQYYILRLKKKNNEKELEV